MVVKDTPKYVLPAEENLSLIAKFRIWLHEYVGIHIHDYHPWSEPVTTRTYLPGADSKTAIPTSVNYAQQRNCKGCGIVRTRTVKKF